MLRINVLVLVSFSEGLFIPEISSGISPFVKERHRKLLNCKIQATLLEMKYICRFVIPSLTIKFCLGTVNSLGVT